MQRQQMEAGSRDAFCLTLGHFPLRSYGGSGGVSSYLGQGLCLFGAQVSNSATHGAG